MTRTIALVAGLLVLLWVKPVPAQQERTDAPGREAVIHWPHARFPTLQGAIDAAPEGATIRIAAGEHRIPEPLFIRRHIRISGAGSGQREGRPVTHLRGPVPQPVVDERGRVLLPAASVRGLFNVVGANVEFSAMRLSGFDAGIAATDPRSRISLRANDVVISETGRGILALAPGEVLVDRSRISATLWNAVSVAPPPDPLNLLWLHASQLLAAANVGAFFKNTTAHLVDQTVDGNRCGGLVGISTTGAGITNSLIQNNGHVGVYLFEPHGLSFISGNHVQNTTDQGPCFHNGGHVVSVGDGVVIGHSQGLVWMVDNTINNNLRAGLLNAGSSVSMSGYAHFCNAFDLEGELFLGTPFDFDNLDPDNIGCGCPAPTGPCIAESAGLAPPEAITEP